MDEMKNVFPRCPLYERKNKVMSITVRQSDLDRMKAFCEITGMNRSTLIRLAVQEYIDNHNKNNHN